MSGELLNYDLPETKRDMIEEEFEAQELGYHQTYGLRVYLTVQERIHHRCQVVVTVPYIRKVFKEIRNRYTAGTLAELRSLAETVFDAENVERYERHLSAVFEELYLLEILNFEDSCKRHFHETKKLLVPYTHMTGNHEYKPTDKRVFDEPFQLLKGIK